VIDPPGGLPVAGGEQAASRPAAVLSARQVSFPRLPGAAELGRVVAHTTVGF
jgi:hypothetical protein